MKVRHRFPTVVLPLVLLALITGVLSCAAPVETGPRAWIDWPLDGYEVDPGTTVTVICHAFAQEGVAEVHLAVDMELYRVVTPDLAGEAFVEVKTEWLADEPGTYLLSVTAFDANGQASNPANVTVRVAGEEPQLILTPGAEETPPPATEAPEQPTTTVAPTETPPPPPTGTPLPPTATPPPPTATPPPPTIVSFTANPSSLTAGGCATLSWAVEGYISEVHFDGQGVGDHDSRQRCPDSTTTYTLRALGPGGETTAGATVNVTQPPSPTPDTQGPPAPGGLSPTGGAEVGCGAVTLSWNPASDASGIGTYYVKVQQITGPPKVGGWTTTDTQYTVSVAWLECGQSYRWAVAAEDALGNMGAWSAWAEFTVEIT
jgi:hypothetical protein